MPIYEFGCPQCGKIKEHILSVRDCPPTLTCDACHAAMQRLISAPSPHQLGGLAGKKRTQELVRKRNADYRKSGKYKDERVKNVESLKRRGIL